MPALRLLEQISGTLRLARVLAERQRTLDLRGLPDQVGRLCAAALDLPPEQGRALRPQLSALLAELDAIAACCGAPERTGRS